MSGMGKAAETPSPGLDPLTAGTGGGGPNRAAEAGPRQFLTFCLAGERYGIIIDSIVEILKYRQSTPIPRAPEVVHGIVSLRGHIVTVIDGRLRLGHSKAQVGPASRIIVVRDGAETVGILVDEVLQVMKLPADAIGPPPETVAQAGECGILGVCDTRQESILILLDVHEFLKV
ncbi:MAG: chemotaxis protein CheW [Acidobacteriota bacterium]